MGMFITKIQIEKSTSPKEYVTGEKIVLRNGDDGRTYTRVGNKEVEVKVEEFSSLDEMKEKILKKRT